jgi:hypothetical protein
MEKKLKGLQLSQLVSLVIAPKLTQITMTEVVAPGDPAATPKTFQVSDTKSNLLFPIMATVAISLLTSSSGKLGGKSTILVPLGLIAVMMASKDSKGTFDLGAILSDPIILVVGFVIVMSLTSDSKLF